MDLAVSMSKLLWFLSCDHKTGRELCFHTVLILSTELQTNIYVRMNVGQSYTETNILLILSFLFIYIFKQNNLYAIIKKQKR